MTISQLSVFAENTPGILTGITERIAAAKVNIRAISVADTQDFGILRLVVSDAEKAKLALKDGDFIVTVTQVIGLVIPDNPGGLSDVLKLLSAHNINVDYVYACITESGMRAAVILHVNDNDGAEKLFSEHNIEMLSEESIHSI